MFNSDITTFKLKGNKCIKAELQCQEKVGIGWLVYLKSADADGIAVSIIIHNQRDSILYTMMHDNMHYAGDKG